MPQTRWFFYFAPSSIVKRKLKLALRLRQKVLRFTLYSQNCKNLPIVCYWRFFRAQGSKMLCFFISLIFFIHFIALPLSHNFIFAMFSNIDVYLLGTFPKFNFITFSFIYCKIIYYIIQIGIINCNCSSAFVI